LYLLCESLVVVHFLKFCESCGVSLMHHPRNKYLTTLLLVCYNYSAAMTGILDPIHFHRPLAGFVLIDN
jgi:hypothetical protein